MFLSNEESIIPLKIVSVEMYGNYEEQSETEEKYIPKIDFSDLSINKKRVPHSQVELASMKKMGDATRSEAEIAHEIELDSLVRQYVPPPDAVHHFFITKQKITEKQTAIMNESVDNYLDQLKKALPPLQQRIAPRILETNEVPLGFSIYAKPTKRTIAKLFDKSKYYESKQPKLSSNLPDIYITQQFKEFVRQSNERMPQVLLDVDISPPQGMSTTPRRKGMNKPRSPRVPRCAFTSRQ